MEKSPHGSSEIGHDPSFEERMMTMIGNIMESKFEDSNKAIDMDPHNAMAYVNRGLAYFNLGNREQAIANYNKAIDLDPHNAMAYLGRGSAYDNAGKRQQAIANYDRAIDLDPKMSEAYAKRADIYSNTGNIDGAISDYKMCAKLEHIRCQSVLREKGMNW